MTLRVMAFNIEEGGAGVDLGKVIEAIRLADPDIVVLQEAMDRFYIIGISLPAPMYSVFSARLGGIPDGTWYDGWNEGTVRILSPEQWFVKPAQ